MIRWNGTVMQWSVELEMREGRTSERRRGGRLRRPTVAPEL